MGDDAEIKIGLSIDTSGLSVAKSQAQSSADAIAAAYDRVAVAAKNNSQAQAQLASVAAAGLPQSQQAAAILAQYETEAVQATAALKALTAATQADAPALENQAVAARNAAAATNSLGISARQSAAASIGILEGRMMSGNRAAAAFLTTTLGLGPALQMAFPVIGLIALGEVAGRVGKALYDAFDMGGERARKTEEEFRGVTDSLRAMNDEISVEIDKLTIANEKLEHKPTNGMKLAIDEAILDADRLDQKLDGILKKVEAGVKGMAGSVPQQMTGFAQGTDYEQTMVSEHSRHLSEQTSVQGQLNESQSYYNSLLIRMNELKEHEAHPDPTAITNNYDTEIAAVQRLINAQAQEQAYIKSTQDLQAAQGEHQKVSDSADAARLAKEAAREQAKARDQFFEESMAQYRDQESESKRISEEITATWVQGQKEQEEADKRADEAARHALEDYKKDHEEQLKMLQEQTSATIKAADEQETAAKKRIAFEEKLGTLTPKQGAQQQLAAVNTAETSQVGALQTQQAAYDPNMGGQELAEYTKIQNEINAVAQKSADQRTQIAQQETLREVAAYKQAYAQMTNAVVSATNTWMTTHKSFANSFIDAGKQLTVQFIDDLLKQGAKFVEQEAMKFAVHEGWVAATKATDATAATAAVATKVATNAAMVAANSALAESEAGLAAVTAAAEAAGGGPLAAIAAGAAMYAAMSPFVAAASAERGGMIPGRQGQAVPIIGHGQELVIPAPLSSMLHNAAMNGGGSGGGHTFHSTYAPQISVLDGKGINSFVSRGADANFAAMRKQARRVNATM